MTRPRIGITTSLNRTVRGDLEQRLDHRYVTAVERAGGLPLIAPMVEDDDAAQALVDLFDGLVVTGGPAVVEGLVGELPDDIDETEPIRLRSDERLLRAFLANQRPTLGICYGMQLANAITGGTLYADVEKQLEVEIHSRGRGGSTHPASVLEGTRFATIVGRSDLEVNTRHVQAIAEPGDGLEVSARARDGVIEAVESSDGSFIGVQFHPEAMSPPLDEVFQNLVDRARDSAKTRI